MYEAYGVLAVLALLWALKALHKANFVMELVGSIAMVGSGLFFLAATLAASSPMFIVISFVPGALAIAYGALRAQKWLTFGMKADLNSSV